MPESNKLFLAACKKFPKAACLDANIRSVMVASSACNKTVLNVSRRAVLVTVQWLILRNPEGARPQISTQALRGGGWEDGDEVVLEAHRQTQPAWSHDTAGEGQFLGAKLGSPMVWCIKFSLL